MMVWKKGIILVLQLYLLRSCGAILTDITNSREFGCSWQGGSTMGHLTCSCRSDEEWIIDSNIPPYDTASIDFKNCRRIIFKPNSISFLTNLRNLRLENITELVLEDYSLAWKGYKKDLYTELDPSISSLKIEVVDSGITTIGSHAFSGIVGEIVLDGTTVTDTSSFAFSSLTQTLLVQIKNTVFHNVQLQTFKKFTTERFELINVTANVLPSRMMSDVYVTDTFLIKDCKFDTVRSSAFVIKSPRSLQILNSDIRQLSAEGLVVTEAQNVLIKDNRIEYVNDGAFYGIRPGKNLLLKLEGNTFTHITRDSLQLPEGTVYLDRLQLNKSCDCYEIDHNLDKQYYASIHCLQDGQYMTVQEFKTGYCSVLSSNTNLIVILSVVGVLAILAVTVLVFFLRRHFRSDKYGSHKQSKKGQLSLIVPDGRTYRETELHVIVEKTDLLTTDL